jgi:hydrogenase maturation protein HypF
VALPGGEAAIREPWRVALSLLDDAFPDGAPTDHLPLFDRVDEKAVAVVRQILAGGLHVPLARGVGRYFDAFGSLFLARPISRHEGQIALAWNVVADESERGAYPFDVSGGEVSEIDLAPAVRASVEEFLAGARPSAISGRFHDTLAAAATRMVSRARERVGDLPVVLTGGCFQNALLAERVFARLASSSRVLLHRQVPPGDGGLALGQAVVAAALARRGGD